MSLGDVFVGREEELDSLLGAWKSASAGTAAAVCVRGESGVGKSALLLRFVQTLREREGTDILVFRSRCYEKENVSYKAFAGLADALGAYLVRVDADRLLHILPPDFPAVARIFPALGHSNLLRGSQLSLPEDPAELRVRAISGFGSLLVRLSRHKPTVVLLDDIQWADQESLRLLESLARHLMREPDAPVLLLLGRRTGVSNPDLDDLLARLAREGFLRFLDVHPLGEDEIRELVARLLARTGDAAKLAPKWSRTIARHAAGNPFLAGEMVRYVQREAEKHSVSSSDIELADALWKRVTDLEPLAQDILVLASLAGGAITEDVLAEACGKHKGDKEWRDTLHELAVLRLVHRVTAAGEDAYEPYHDRIREEIRERIDPNRRREVHRRLALAFERRPDRYAEAAAWHWWEAGEREAAKKHYVRAARQAAERLAFLRAAQLFGMALQEEKDPKQRALLAMEQGEAYRNAGHALQAVSSFDRAIRDASDAALRLRAQFLATEQLLKAGYVERASAGVGRVFKALGESLPGSGFQAVAALLWQRSALRLQGLEYEARDPSQIPERDKTVADILGNLSIGFSMVDPVLSGYLGARFLRLVLEMGDEERIATGLALEAALSSARSIRGQPRAKQLIAQSAAIATRLDVPKLAALTKLAQGVTHYFAGEWTSCIRTLEAALEVLRRKCYGVGWELATTITYLTFAYMMRGQLSRAWQLMEENIEDATQRGDMFLVANLQTIVGIVLLAQDQADELARRLENLLDTWPRDRYTVQHFYLLYSESELSLYRGDVERAWNLLTSQWRPLTRHQLHRFLIIRAEFWRALGRVALAMAAQSEGKDRQRYLKTAAKVAKRLEAERTGYTSAWAGHLRAGIAYLREGPTARVASLYEQAASELRAGEMEMHALSAEARHAQIVGDEARLKQTFDAMRREGVQKPEQFVNILSPGFS